MSSIRRLAKSQHLITLLLAAFSAALGVSAPAAAQQTFFVDKKICQWTNSPSAPDPNGCTPVVGQVIPGQPVFYQLRIDGPVNGAAWSVTLAETYPVGFAGNVQNVRCVPSGSTTPVFTAQIPTATSLGPIAVASGQTVYCAMAGYFTAATTTSTSAKNIVGLTATSQNGATGTGGAEVNATVQTTAQLPTNLSITKSASPATVALGGSTTFSITISNATATNGGQPVFLGGFLRLFDKLAKPLASIPLTATLQSGPACTAAGGAVCPASGVQSNVSSPLAVSANSANPQPSWQQFASWAYGSGNSGFMPAGGSITISYTVKVDSASTCAPPTGHELDNVAFFDLLGQPGATVTDANTSDNTSAVAKVNLTHTLPACVGGGTSPSYILTKTRVPSTTAPTSWSTNVTYQVVFKNTSASDFTNVNLYDLVYGPSPTPPFTATLVSATCTGCTGTGPSGPQSITSYGSGVTMWNTTAAATLAKDASITLDITLRYDMISCAPASGASWPIQNYGRVAFTFNGTNYNYLSTVAQIKMDQPPLCDFSVTKSFVGGAPSTLLFDPALYTYKVEFTNTAGAPRTMFTILDSLRIDEQFYATNTPFEYRFKCGDSGGVTYPTGYTGQNIGYPNYANGTVQWTNNEVNGAPIFQLGAGGITFAANAKLTCTVDIKVKRPAAGDPNCMGTGAADLQNTAMIFPNAGYNTNTGPPSDPDLYESVIAPLPRCYNLTVNKLVNPAVSAPSGPALNYTIEVVNDGHSIVGLANPNWLLLSDVFTGTYSPGAASVAVSNPSGPGCGASTTHNCEWIASSGNPVSLAIKNLAAGQKLTVTFSLPPPLVAPNVRNDVKIEPKGSLVAEWYAREPETLVDFMIVPINAASGQGKICVRKFNDANGDGVRQSNEAWLAGWSFQILDQNGATAATGVTASHEGSFCTPATLPAATYSVVETIQSGWTNTAPGGGSEAVTIGPGQWSETVVFGNCKGCKGQAVVKVCKIARESEDVGKVFTFSVGGQAVSVPAGPAPGGYCAIAGESFAEGAPISVVENGPAGFGVTDISVEPAAAGGTENLEEKSVVVTPGPGVTEVTFVNVPRTGYLEICKLSEDEEAPLKGDFTFAVEGVEEPVVVRAESCSPAIQTPAGVIEVVESPTPGLYMTGCWSWPAQTAQCPQGGPITVEVEAGDVSEQTILFVWNHRQGASGLKSAEQRLKQLQQLPAFMTKSGKK